MDQPLKRGADRTVDILQQRLTEYACKLKYADLPADVIHSVKVRTIDTLGALIGGFFAESSRIARNLAAEMPSPRGATVIGTRMKTTPDMAAFVNSTTHRYIELTDSYHFPGANGGHPSDVLTPLLAVAEYVQASGREFILSVVLAYEIYLRISDVFDNSGFDHTNFCCMGTAVGSAKLMQLTNEQFAHCISMAIVPNNSLRIARLGYLSMWKSAATGQAGKAAVFAALLARAGMEGPHLPFEGKSGWFDNVALKHFSLDTLGGNGMPFKIIDTSIKLRPASGLTLAPMLAAEKIGAVSNLKDVKQVIVEVNKKAKALVGTHAYHWNPDTKETADHSVAYLVAATLMDGVITPRSFNDAHLWNPELRALMQKVEVHENNDYTKAYESVPAVHLAKVTVETSSGNRLVGQSGGGSEDLSTPKSDGQIEEKFRSLTEDYLGAKRVSAILDRLWNLDGLKNVVAIPTDFVLD